MIYGFILILVKKVRQLISIHAGKMWYLPLLFIFWRVADLCIAYLAKVYDKYNENFPYRFELYEHKLRIPNFLVNFANYDGAHYLHIAHNGYGGFEQAFFPLFPLLVKVSTQFFYNSYFLSGFYLSNIFFLGGIFVFWKFLTLIGISKRNIVWFFLFLFAFPTSFFFGAVYTEGLFFFLVATSFYALVKKNWILFIVASYMAALTRLMGVFLCIPALLLFVGEAQNIKTAFMSWSRIDRKIWGHLGKLIPLLAPIAGLASYMIYLAKTTGDPLLFYHLQTSFGANRSTHIIFLPQVYFRYLKIFITANHSFTYSIAILEFIVFNIVLFALLYNLWKLIKKKKDRQTLLLLGLNFFSLINILLPTTTGTLTSIPRYSILSLSFFVQLASLEGKHLKPILLASFVLVHALLLILFIQGYFIG